MKTLLLFIALVLIASTVEAKEQPFARTKANKYSQTGFKKHGKKKSKAAFSCVRHKKVNRKGLMR